MKHPLPTSIRLETDRLVLRLPRLDDASGTAEYLTDPQVMRFLGGETVPREKCTEVVQKWLDRWEQNGLGHFVLERRTDGRFVGRVGLIVWDTRTWRHTTLADGGAHAQPELGWALVGAHWGHGYATEAARAVRDLARRERRVERLISLIAPDPAMSSSGITREQVLSVDHAESE